MFSKKGKIFSVLIADGLNLFVSGFPGGRFYS
jgi:hypothetical protein